MAYNKRAYNDRLSNLSTVQREELAAEVKDYILDSVASSVSPVTGYSFPSLKTGGSSDLRETGAMLSTLTVFVTSEYVDVGVGSSQAGKARGNQIGIRGLSPKTVNPRPFVGIQASVLEGMIDEMEAEDEELDEFDLFDFSDEEE